jgi:hypothetical protein
MLLGILSRITCHVMRDKKFQGITLVGLINLSLQQKQRWRAGVPTKGWRRAAFQAN